MNLYYTQHPHGILCSSQLIGEASDQGCRMAEHKGALYAAYLGEGDVIKLITRQAASEREWATLETGRNSSGVPGLFSFKSTLYMVYKNAQNMTVLCRYAEPSKSFVTVAQMNDWLSQTPAFAVLNGTLHMFYKTHDSANLYHKTTANLSSWRRRPVIKTDGKIAALTHLSPVAATYQNLIHLIYSDRESGHCFLLKSDGTNWTSRIPLINQSYPHSPGLTVHDGLLTLAFAGQDNALHQYTYDGHCVSAPVASTLLTCAPVSPTLAAQDGQLTAVFSQ
ncbi:hypothetical protein [Pseudomonas sp. RC10]|uniref:hypothetical protein n=1 Tax=Pseudomonas bambusae TaxID=3139142 RepID=UPI003138DB5A